MNVQQLKKLLESRHEREVLDGLRRVVSQSQRAEETTAGQYLPTVLKNISSPNANIRKLVYIYLLANAESDPDTALLSINSIQKALSAPDAHLRALALRTISSLQVPVIAQIVSLGIRKGAADMSPIVRRTAALAIPKCWRLDASTAPQLEKYIGQLLGDRQYYVAGAAVLAYRECCPDNIDLIHPHYRSLVKMLVDMDEWSQLATLRVLTSYARRCFARRKKRLKNAMQNTTSKVSNIDDFYSDESKTQATNSHKAKDDDSDNEITDPDLELLLKSIQPLLHSRSSAVIISVARLYLALTAPSHNGEPSFYTITTVGPLVSLLRSPLAILSLALHNIVSIMLLHPKPFVRYTRHFLLHTTDTPETSSIKLSALSLIFPHAPAHTQSLILNELVHAARSPDSALVRAAISALGRCAQSSAPSSPSSRRCLRLLLAQSSKPQSQDADAATAGLVTSEALTQIRHLIQSDPAAHKGTVIRLSKDLDTTVHPAARASIVWLVGEYAAVDAQEDHAGKGLGNVAADVLRILAGGFGKEDEMVKRQILILSTKVYLSWLNALRPLQEEELPQFDDTDADGATLDKAIVDDNPATSSTNPSAEQTPPHPIPLLYNYIHHLIRYDTSYTLRDLARVHRALLPPNSSSVTTTSPLPTDVNTQLATLLFLSPKPAPNTTSSNTTNAHSHSTHDTRLGSATLVLGNQDHLPGYEDLPDWVTAGQEPDARLRDGNGGAGGASGAYAGGSVGGGATTAAAGARLDAVSGAAAATVPGRGGGGGVAGKTLDDWLDESGGSDEEDASEDEDEDGSDDGSAEEESDSGETGSEESEEEELESDEDEDEDEEDERGKLMKQ